jgi:hypothetical protein
MDGRSEAEMRVWINWTEIRQFGDLKLLLMTANEWRKRIQDAPEEGFCTWQDIEHEVTAMIRMSKAMTRTLELIKQKGMSQRPA